MKKPILGFVIALPVPFFVLLISILYGYEGTWIYEPPFLLQTLNTIFLFGIPIFVATLATLTYLKDGGPVFLLLGCGSIFFGISSLFAGWGLGLGGPNFTVTIHNVGSAVGGLLHLAAGLYSLKSNPSLPKRSPRNKWLIFITK